MPKNNEEVKKFFLYKSELNKITKNNNKKLVNPNKEIIIYGKPEKMGNYLTNYRQYNQLRKMYPNINVFNLCDTLGMFEYPQDGYDVSEGLKCETIRAKAFECIRQLKGLNIDAKNIGLKDVLPYNERRSEFIYRNLKQILMFDGNNSESVLKDIFSYYDKVELYHKNKSGKLTRFDLDKFYQIKLAITNLNHQSSVANILAPYLINKDQFDFAEKLYRRACVLQEKINKTGDLFDNIEDYADSGFVFKFLKHNDLNNLVLGYECDSCAKIGGSGESILTESMTNPKYRNLVILNEKNKIIAKSTMYLSNDQVIFNSFELSKSLRISGNTELKTLTSKQKEEVVNTFERACITFCKHYYLKTGKHIKRICLGMETSDLQSEFEKKFGGVVNDNILMPNFKNYESEHNAHKQIEIYKNKNILCKNVSNNFE